MLFHMYDSISTRRVVTPAGLRCLGYLALTHDSFPSLLYLMTLCLTLCPRFRRYWGILGLYWGILEHIGVTLGSSGGFSSSLCDPATLRFRSSESSCRQPSKSVACVTTEQVSLSINSHNRASQSHVSCYKQPSPDKGSST
jgi:hypothetical protein